MDKYILIRAVTVDECPWLEDTVLAGTIVEHVGDPWGCCGPDGLMVEYEGCKCPTELPESAMRPYPGATLN